MKYQIVGIEHSVGDFTPNFGKNAGQSQHYDLYRVHTLTGSRIVGGKECAVVRVTPDKMGEIIADCGGQIENVVNHVFDFEVRSSFGKLNLMRSELVK